MIRYTTPSYELTIEGVDLTGFDVYVTFSQNGQTLTIEDPPITVEDETTTITCELTQEQSASFKQGRMEVQVNWVDAVGKRSATVIKQVPVLAQLLQEVK